MRRWITALALGLVLWPAGALAHAPFRSAEPPPGVALAVLPAEVRVVLGAPVETRPLRASVLAPGAGEWRAVAVRRAPRDPDVLLLAAGEGGSGPHVYRWTALSQAGGVSRGRLTLAVGPGSGGGAESDARDGPLTLAGRGLALAGPIALLGLVLLRFGVVAPAIRRGGLAPIVGAPAPWPAVVPDTLAGATRIWWRAWWAAIAAAAVGLTAALAGVLGELGAAGDLGAVLAGRWGTGWLMQAGALGVACLAGVALARSRAGGGATGPGWWGVALGAPPALALAAISWSGHAAADRDATLGIAADAVHNWASAAWLGGLVGLVVLPLIAARRLAEAPRVRLLAAIVVRFSALAQAAVGALVITGVYRALAVLGDLGDLVGTGYGRALAIKLALFGVMMGVAGYNRFVLHTRLERAALGLAGDERGASRALAVSIRAELLLAAAVLVAVTLLVGQPISA